MRKSNNNNNKSNNNNNKNNVLSRVTTAFQIGTHEPDIKIIQGEHIGDPRCSNSKTNIIYLPRKSGHGVSPKLMRAGMVTNRDRKQTVVFCHTA